MALTGTDRGTGGNNSGATSLTITFPQALAQQSLGVLCIALDNAGSAGGTAAAPTTATDSKGNVWTRRQDGIYDNGAASAGVEVAIYTAFIAQALTTSDTVVLSWIAGVSVTAKAFALHEFTAAANKAGDYVTGAVGTGATTGTPTVTSSSLTSGDAIIGVAGVESADTWAGDADTTNGNWSAQQHTAFGTGTSGMAVTTQRKVVTGTATQTYNPTCTSADTMIAWISIRERNAYVLAATQATFTLTGQAIALAVSTAATQETFTLTGQAATLTYVPSTGSTLTVSQATFTLTGQAVALAVSTAATQATLSLTGQALNFLIAHRVTAAQATFTLSSQVAALDALKAASQATFTLTGQAAGLLTTRNISAAQSTFTLGIQDAPLTRALIISSTQAGFDFTGQGVNFTSGRGVVASAASFNLTCEDIAFSSARVLTTAGSLINLTCESAALVAARIVTLDATSFAYSGYDIEFLSGVSSAFTLGISVASFTLTGNDIQFRTRRNAWDKNSGERWRRWMFENVNIFGLPDRSFYYPKKRGH